MPPAMTQDLVIPRNAPLKRKIAAIMAADVSGYSRLVAEDEERTLRDLAAAREIFDGLVDASGGRIFNTAGDSVMCEFDSAVEAVRVAIEIQAALHARSAGVDPARRLAFRIGITIGDVVERDGDLLGDGVNMAARLESIAPAGGLCISRSVHEAVANKIPVTFRESGPRQVKNIAQPVHAFMLDPPDAPRLSSPTPFAASGRVTPSETGGSRPRRTVGLAIGLAALAGIGALAAPVLPALKGAMPGWLGASSTQQMALPADATAPASTAAADPGVAEKPAPRAAAPKPPARASAEKQPAAEAAPGGTAQSPAEAAAAFAALGARGLVPDATTLAELYHNARFLEAKGDRPAALRAYAAAAPLATAYVDPLMRYASLVRATSGAEAARKAIDALGGQSPSKPLALMAAMQADGAERRRRLDALAGDGSFLPADYFLAEALMERRAPGPTLAERRLAFAALERFLDGGHSTGLQELFVDRTFLDGWLDAARGRRGEIETFFAAAATRPTVGFAQTANGWTARFRLPEPAGSAEVRIGEAGDPLRATLQLAGEPGGRTGSTAEVPLPPSTGRTTLYLTYRDLSGREAGPFPLPFDPGSALATVSRERLERFADTWVTFRSDLPDLLSYAQLAVNRCAIAQARIGFGDEAPTQPLPIPSCDGAAGASPPEQPSVLALPPGTDSVQVQIAYQDGSDSPVRTFRRP